MAHRPHRSLCSLGPLLSPGTSTVAVFSSPWPSIQSAKESKTITMTHDHHRHQARYSLWSFSSIDEEEYERARDFLLRDFHHPLKRHSLDVIYEQEGGDGDAAGGVDNDSEEEEKDHRVCNYGKGLLRKRASVSCLRSLPGSASSDEDEPASRRGSGSDSALEASFDRGESPTRVVPAGGRFFGGSPGTSLNGTGLRRSASISNGKGWSCLYESTDTMSSIVFMSSASPAKQCGHRF